MQQPSSPHEEDWVVVSEEHRDQDELLDACYAEIRAIKVEEVDWEKTSLIDYYIQQVRLPFIQKFGCAVFTLPVIEHSPVANPLIDYDRRLFKVYEEHVVRGFMDRLFEAAVSKQFAKMFASLGPHLDKQQIEDHVHLIVCTEEMQAYRKICEKKVLILFYVSQILQFTDLDARRGTGETRETSSVSKLQAAVPNNQAVSVPTLGLGPLAQLCGEANEKVSYPAQSMLFDIIGCVMAPVCPLFSAYAVLSLGSLATKLVFNHLWTKSQTLDPKLVMATSVMNIIDHFRETLPDSIALVKSLEQSASYLNGRLDGDYRSDITFREAFQTLMRDLANLK